MAQHVRTALVDLFGAIALFSLTAAAGAVPIVWTGLNTSFSKDGSADVTLPVSQDRLTDNVWLTRASTEGPFNIAPGKEVSYVRFTSPADTQWATDVMPANSGKTITATNWSQLAFTDWAPAYGGPGSALLGNILTHSAVVHLVTDDVYLNLTFNQFDSSGSMAYQRSTPAVAEPTGDYNHDGGVDAADYVVWRNSLSQSAAPAGSGADGNGDGTIDADDFTFWRQRFGNVIAGSGAGGSLQSATSIPEPSTAVLQLLGLFALIRRSSRFHIERAR